jgi:hypothetical protein
MIVALVNQVVLLVGEVNSVVMPTPSKRWPVCKLGIHVKRWDDADVEKVDKAMERLDKQGRRSLIEPGSCSSSPTLTSSRCLNT